MAFVLDTDHLVILQQRNQPAFKNLTARLGQTNPDDIFATIISFHEQMQGWLAFLNRSRSPSRIVMAYTELDEIGRSFFEMNVLPLRPCERRRTTGNHRRPHKGTTCDVRRGGQRAPRHARRGGQRAPGEGWGSEKGCLAVGIISQDASPHLRLPVQTAAPAHRLGSCCFVSCRRTAYFRVGGYRGLGLASVG